ncbi:MAG: short-chain fatty acyl-CoA regulator family protein [Alphaproteobacteria bacterium]|nr:short-chain fatty acyl-CoA regulator family protein [Alphaproteobacteria bacterium]
MVRELLGFKIRERRKELGFTQAGLAKTIGISPSYLNLIEANKRTIAGALLNRIAGELHLDAETLAGKTERRLIDDLRELAADPLLRSARLSEDGASDLVARHPGWARALLTLHRGYVDKAQTVDALSDRMSRDPALGEAVHQILTHITSIRSASEILEHVDDLAPDQQRRFHAIMAGESAKLAGVAQTLTQFFDLSAADTRSVTPAEEVDDFIIERGNYFPALELAAEDLRRQVQTHGETFLSALIDFLSARHGVTMANRSPVGLSPEGRSERFHNQCRYDPETKTMEFLDNAAIATRRFQLARLAAQLCLTETIEAEIEDPRLTTDMARSQAFRALGSYAASAMLFPYDRFFEDAESTRYDFEILRQRYTAGFEQICHRLVTLRKPGSEGVPFAFLRSNPAGHATKRFPLPGLPLPRHGHACPLWAIYGAFQTPGRVVRQLAAFPDQSRFLFIARTVTKQPATFHEPQFLYSVMLACDAIHADRTVYAEGIDLVATQAASEVGPSCRLCPRTDCMQREEEPILGL